jgi:hypothetical protein
MGAKQTEALYTVYNRVAANVEIVNKAPKGALRSQYENLKTLQEQLEKAQNAAKGQSVQQQIDSKKAIEAIDDRIKKIKEEADARRKALSQQQQDEDSLTQIKKKQLEYQQALAAGDMATAAQAQLDIQSINRQQQVTQATRAIDNKEAADIAKLEKQRDALSKKDENLANKAAKAAESIGSLIEKINKQKEAIDTFNSAVTNLQMAIIEGKKDIRGESAAVVKAGEAAGVESRDQDKIVGYRTTRGRMTYRQKTPEELAQGYMPTTLDKALNADKVYINAKNILTSESESRKSEGISVTSSTGPSSRGRTNYQTSAKSLMDQGIKLLPGTTFVDSTGKKYKILGNPSRSGSVEVTPFAMGGMVTNRPLAMPKFNRMGMGGPVVNSVPRYNSGGYVSSSRPSSSSSVIIKEMPVYFQQSPNNPKEFFAQMEELARQKGIKVSQGKSA